jgi:hypothetical protein
MRIRLDDPSYSIRLRDYFLRLGAVGTIEADGIVDVRFPEDDGAEAEEYLTSWAEANRVQAVLAGEAAPVGHAEFEVVPRALDLWQAPVRVGDLLLSKGFITKEQLTQALEESRKNGELMGEVLLRHRWVFEDELARTLAEQWSLPYLNLASVGVDPSAMALLPSEVGRKAAAVPVRFVDGGIQVAFADPTDPEALDAVRTYMPSMQPAVAELTDIMTLWRRPPVAA